MSKLFYSANGKTYQSTNNNIIEKMSETSETLQKRINALDLIGNLEIKGDIKAMRYLDVNGNPLSFADSKGTYTIGSLTDQQGQIGIGVTNPRSQLHVGKTLTVDKDIKLKEDSSLCFGEKCIGANGLDVIKQYGEKIEEHSKLIASNPSGNNIAREIYEITGNIPHPDRAGTDGMIYRADGQVQFATDDLIRMRHVGSKQTGIQFDTSPGTGLISTPDGTMKISRSGIMFGGSNNQREVNSAQISAGVHVPNSLNIVGMSSDTNLATRKVDVWAEGGMTIRGPVNLRIDHVDNRNEKLTPTEYRRKGKGTYHEFKQNYLPEVPGFSVVETIVPWDDVTGGRIKQIIKGDTGIFYRTGLTQGNNDTEWSPVVSLSSTNNDSKAVGTLNLVNLSKRIDIDTSAISKNIDITSAIAKNIDIDTGAISKNNDLEFNTLSLDERITLPFPDIVPKVTSVRISPNVKMVMLSGFVRAEKIINGPPDSGRIYVTIGTLPEGLRPSENKLFSCATSENGPVLNLTSSYVSEVRSFYPGTPPTRYDRHRATNVLITPNGKIQTTLQNYREILSLDGINFLVF